MQHPPNELFIDGQWRPSSDGGRIDVINPATEEVVDRVARATPRDLDDALAAAARGFAIWRHTNPWERSKVLRRTAVLLDERANWIAKVMTEEQGKPLAEATAEVQASAAYFDWFADEARRIYGRFIPASTEDVRILTMRKPLGPVVMFTAWNFPAVLIARKLSAALAAGCSVIAKPAEEAPRTALCLAQALHDAGLPAGVCNMVMGDPPQISEHLIRSEVVRKVSLTGSVPVGRQLLHLAADGLKPTSMELGGHAPVIVFDDADLNQAVATCLSGKYRNTGQVCISPSRFFVHDALADAFADRFSEQVTKLRLGDGRDPATDVGPLSNQRRLDSIQELIDDAVAQGARITAGGHRAAAFERGLFFEPTVLTDVDATMRIMQEEPFGPVAPIVRFDDFDDVIARANATEYGLAGYVFTRNLRTAMLAAEALEVGMVGVNNLVIARPEAPFGGIKKSGFGREGGAEGIDEYLVDKYVNLRL